MYDGRSIFFAGKAGATDEWQIYQEDVAGRNLQKLTSLPGGTMNPTLLPDGRVVFVSPVPKIGGTHSSQPLSALYVQSPGGQPRRLTFSVRTARCRPGERMARATAPPAVWVSTAFIMLGR